MQTSLLKIIFALAIVMIGLALPLGCGKDGPTGGGGVDSLRASITSPTDGAVVHGPTPLQVQVTGSSGNAKVKFIVDAIQASLDSVAPWEYVWDPTPLQNGSSHTFRAIASDNSGNADTTSTRTYFANYAKLTMTVQSPTDGSVIPTTQLFGATVTGGAGGTVVDFKVDNVIVASDSVTPFQYSWDPSSLPSGSAHTVQLTAADTAGQTAASTVRTVYAKHLPLSVTLSSPADSSIIGQVEDILVTVSGGAGGNTVSFILDGSPIFVDNTPPLAYRWDPTSLLNGSAHTVYAIVSDTGGQTDTTLTRVYFANWRLLGSSSQSPHPINVWKIFARSSSTNIDFRVEYSPSWSSYDSAGIDCALYLDSDQDGSTGRTTVTNSFGISEPINDIGAEYRCIVGIHGDSVWVNNSGVWGAGRLLRAVNVSDSSYFFECSMLRSDVGFSDAFDLVVANVHFISKTSWTYDWVPISGHLSCSVDGRYVGPPVSSSAL